MWKFVKSVCFIDSYVKKMFKSSYIYDWIWNVHGICVHVAFGPIKYNVERLSISHTQKQLHCSPFQIDTKLKERVICLKRLDTHVTSRIHFLTHQLQVPYIDIQWAGRCMCQRLFIPDSFIGFGLYLWCFTCTVTMSLPPPTSAEGR